MNMNKAELVSALKALGVKSGGVLLVHSAMSSLGDVEGGADTVIDALLEVVGAQGTLCMPAFCDNVTVPFDMETSKSDSGIITELFRKREGVQRSMQPTHSVCAIGPLADEMLKDHSNCKTACGENSPFGKLVALGGQILLLGVDMNRNTTLHCVEEAVDSQSLLPIWEVAMPTYMDGYEGKKIMIEKGPLGHRDFLKLTPQLRKNKLVREGYIGKAACKLMNAAPLFDFCVNLLKKDPAAFLCENKYCNSCVHARYKMEGKNLKSPHADNKCGADFCEVCSL